MTLFAQSNSSKFFAMKTLFVIFPKIEQWKGCNTMYSYKYIQYYENIFCVNQWKVRRINNRGIHLFEYLCKKLSCGDMRRVCRFFVDRINISHNTYVKIPLQTTTDVFVFVTMTYNSDMNTKIRLQIVRYVE